MQIFKRINERKFSNKKNDLDVYLFEKSINSDVVIACIGNFCETLQKKTVLLPSRCKITDFVLPFSSLLFSSLLFSSLLFETLRERDAARSLLPSSRQRPGGKWYETLRVPKCPGGKASLAQERFFNR
jgi:hypothetical protein